MLLVDFHRAVLDVVVPVPASGGCLLPDLQPTLHCLQQRADGFAVGGDLDLHSLRALQVDDRVGLASLVVYVLGDVYSTAVALGAKGAPTSMNEVGILTVRTVRGMFCKSTHHIVLVVAGLAGVDRRGLEADSASGRRHCGGSTTGRVYVWFLMDVGVVIVVVGWHQ